MQAIIWPDGWKNPGAQAVPIAGRNISVFSSATPIHAKSPEPLLHQQVAANDDLMESLEILLSEEKMKRLDTAGA